MWTRLLSGQAWNGELINRRKNGQEYYENALIFPIRNDAGDIVRWFGTNTDITEQREAEESLRLMAQAFTISLFLTLRGGFMAYDVNLALTGGGPYRTTELISMHIFQDAFRLGNFGTGQSKAVIMFVLVAVAALVQVSVSKRMEVQR